MVASGTKRMTATVSPAPSGEEKEKVSSAKERSDCTATAKGMKMSLKTMFHVHPTKKHIELVTKNRSTEARFMPSPSSRPDLLPVRQVRERVKVRVRVTVRGRSGVMVGLRVRAACEDKPTDTRPHEQTAHGEVGENGEPGWVGADRGEEPDDHIGPSAARNKGKDVLKQIEKICGITATLHFKPQLIPIPCSPHPTTTSHHTDTSHCTPVRRNPSGEGGSNFIHLHQNTRRHSTSAPSSYLPPSSSSHSPAAGRRTG